MRILVVGRGKLGQAITAMCEAKRIPYSVPTGPGISGDRLTGYPSVAVYCGKGNRWEELVDWCRREKIPLINASTDVQDPREVKYIKVPNTSLPMVMFMEKFPAFAKSFIDMGMTIDIVESHQASKSSKSGTARAIADKLGIKHDDIIDVRKKGLQRMLGVPETALDKHASHFFVLSNGEVRIKIITEIISHDTYASGLIRIATAVDQVNQAHQLEIGNHPVAQFIL